MMKRLAWLVLLLVAAIPIGVQADVAPPLGPPGANPSPEGETTQVRMMDETVLLEVLETQGEKPPGRARVTADFTLRNLGGEPETMAARFPLSCNNGFYEYPEVKNLRVSVEGTPLATRRIDNPSPCGGDELVPWAAFDVSFPPGEDVRLRVTYEVDGTGERSMVSFYYILETGAGWQGTIGSADLIVRLPHPATAETVMLEGTSGWSTTTAGGVLTGNEIRWHYDDLEPTSGHNLEVTVVRPDYWSAVIERRQQVARTPGDGEAWGQLAKAIKEVIAMRRGIREDAGGLALYDQSVEAYEKALERLPDDALWHAGFADLLATKISWASYLTESTRAESLRALEAIRIALELAPRNARVREIAETVSWTFPDAMQQADDGNYDFLWLTATPTLRPPEPTPTEPASPEPTATQVPPTAASLPASDAATPAAEPKPSSGSSLPCGSAAVAVAPVALLLARRSRRKSRRPAA